MTKRAHTQPVDNKCILTSLSGPHSVTDVRKKHLVEVCEAIQGDFF